MVPPEASLASLTALPRTEWAEARDDFFSFGANKESLDIVESAMFVLHLDPHSPSFQDLSAPASHVLHSDGTARWCDKSFNVVVFANGRAGIQAEHSWGDAPIIAHVWEWVLGQSSLQLH